MRAFLICSIVFLLLVGGVIANCFFVRHTVSDLEDRCEALISLEKELNDVTVATATSQSQALHREWKTHYSFLCLTISDEELLPISQAITQLCVYAEVGLCEEYEMCRDLILSQLDRLKVLESPAWYNLL